MGKERVDGVLVFGDPVAFERRAQIADFAVRSRLPTIYNIREFVEVGGLMSYGASLADQCRRAATYVDKILKGAKPADLPVEQPMKFEFIINLKDGQADRIDNSSQCAGAGGQGDQMTVGSEQKAVSRKSNE